MNGHEFLAEYEKYDYTSTIVTMLTSSDQDADKETSMQYPFVKQYITKPISIDCPEFQSLMALHEIKSD